jgi:hypothetical protein
VSDKRSVATDALETLGTIIGEGAGRDAIHLAVEPVIAGEVLRPGEDVGLLPDGKASHHCEHLGIVDPFLKKPVKRGEKFWLVVYPRQITSLRHVWSHPAFPEELHPAFHEEEVPSELTEADQENARIVAGKLMGMGEKWLRDFCEQGDCPSYEAIMEAIKNGGSSVTVEDDDYGYGVTINGDYISVSGSDAHGNIPPEFWEHVEVVTGKKQILRPTHFSCSC